MRFVDATSIHVRSGHGGDGVVSFRREKNVPLGGPDGGDGGDGGSVLLVADRNLDTLLPLARTRTYAAGNGRPGRGANRHGAAGADLVVKVPVGTVAKRGGEVLADLDRDGQTFTAARGGRGGRGNRSFAGPLNQAPREFTYGEEGEEHDLELELKLIADVGLLGFPNAGKSTLLARISAARPKIADYPFTTMQPQLGIVSDGRAHELVMADIPGIIDGAAAGAGMGLEFLRHVERCRFLLHLVDLVPLDGTCPWDKLRVINQELEKFSPALAAKPQLVVGNKLDLTGAREALRLMRAETGEKVLGISAVSGEGIKELVREMFRL